MDRPFYNRREAGQRLAQKLTLYANCSNTIVLGLPRGGIPVAYEIANYLNLALDICLVRKLGLPFYPETAMGAIALSLKKTASCSIATNVIPMAIDFSSSLPASAKPIAEATLAHDQDIKITIVDQKTVLMHGVTQEQIDRIIAQETVELSRRNRLYRNSRPPLKVKDCTLILVDDGIATGLTILAAVTTLSQHQPKKIIIATPVASPSAIEQLTAQVDGITCLKTPKSFNAVGFWYQDFSQTTDQEVCELLSQEASDSFAGSC